MIKHSMTLDGNKKIFRIVYRVASPLMERFDFLMNSDCAMIKINMKEFRFVYLQKTHEIILLTALPVPFANHRCFLLFIKARRIF